MSGLWAAGSLFHFRSAR